MVISGNLQLKILNQRICRSQDCKPGFIGCVSFDSTGQNIIIGLSYRIVVHHEREDSYRCSNRVINLKWGRQQGLRNDLITWRAPRSEACEWYQVINSLTIRWIKFSLELDAENVACRTLISYSFGSPVYNKCICWYLDIVILEDKVDRHEAVIRSNVPSWPGNLNSSAKNVLYCLVSSLEWNWRACCCRTVINSKHCYFSKVDSKAFWWYQKIPKRFQRKIEIPFFVIVTL